MKAKRLIVTSSGTPDEEHLSVTHFHRLAVQAGYSRCNHHFVITRDGETHRTRDLEEPGLSLGGALKKYNIDSHSVMLVGTKKFTEGQLKALLVILGKALEAGLVVMSHSELCINNNVEDSGRPGFSLSTFLEERDDGHG